MSHKYDSNRVLGTHLELRQTVIKLNIHRTQSVHNPYQLSRPTMCEIQNYRQSHTVLKNLVITELWSNHTSFITHLQLKQWWLQIICVGVQKLVLSDHAVERFSNQWQVTLGVTHFAPETAWVVCSRRQHELIHELARIVHNQLNGRPIISNVNFRQKTQSSNVSQIPNEWGLVNWRLIWFN